MPAPVGGWNPDAMAWDLPTEQAAQLDNFLIRPGKITMRGGFGTYGSFKYATPASVCGWVGGSPNWWQIQSRATAAVGSLVDPWLAPLSGATAATLGQPTGSVRFINLSGSTTVAVTKDQAPGPRWINFDGHGISYGASTAPTTSTDTNNSYTTTNTNLLTLPWHITTATAPTAHPLAPRGAFDIMGYQSRIWLLGGVDTPGGLTAHEPTTLFFTNPISSGGGFVAADWKDPVSGLTNKIRMDNDTSDFGVGLAVVRNGMLVFRRNSVWLLRGSTTSNYALQPITRDLGCIDARSIVETSTGVYFLSMQGLMFTSGTTVTNVSGPVLRTLQSALLTQQIRSTNAGVNYAPTYATAAKTSQGQIVMSLGWHDPSTGSIYPVFAAMYDPETHAWTRITSSIWTQGTSDSVLYSTFPQTAYAPNAYPGILMSKDNPKVLTSLCDMYPTMWEDLYYGYSFLSPDGNWNGIAGGLYDKDNTGTFQPIVIPSVWQTGLLPTISTSRRRHAQGKRMYLDSRLIADNGFASAPGFQVMPVDASGNQIGTTVLNGAPPMQAANGGWVNTFSVQASGGNLQVERANQDWYQEVTSDVALRLTLPGSGTITNASLATQADVYGMGIEFQATRDAR